MSGSAAKNVPILVATDLGVVDEQLNLLSESFNKDLKIDVFRKHPELICVRHVVTGCTMMFNRAAKEASLPMSPRATMHDEWVALCVHFKGGIISILDEATILYRLGIPPATHSSAGLEILETLERYPVQPYWMSINALYPRE